MAGVEGSENHVPTESRSPDPQASSQSLNRQSCLNKIIWFIQMLPAVK